MRNRLLLLVLSILCLTSTPPANASNWATSISVPVVVQDPDFLHGARITIDYQPKRLIWQHTQIYFNAGAGHWWVSNTTRYHNLNIYSVAPILRYYFYKTPYFSPYVHLSIGFAYLTQTRLDGRNLGMHFVFQDELGLGATLGATQQLSMMLSMLHYSNGSLCNRNAGITIPVVFTVGYKF